MKTSSLFSIRISDIDLHPPARLCWPAIIAGLVTTLAVQIVLMMLGAGLGLASFNPSSDGDHASSFGIGAAIVQGISTLLSLWAGGWVAGRFLGAAGARTGRLHGFMVWSSATVLALMLVTSGIGWALGGIGKMVGGGVSMAGPSAMQGLADMAKDATAQSKSLFSSFTDEGSSLAPSTRNSADSIRAKRDLSIAISRMFTGDASAMAANQQAVVKLLVETQGTPEPEARRLVDSWVSSYQSMKADADAAMKKVEIATREAAEKSANVLSVVALASFVTFLLGAIAASLGGMNGATCAWTRHEASPLSKL